MKNGKSEEAARENSTVSTSEGSPMVSPWVEITQEMIDSFGAATLDPDPMHVSPEWARKQGPFGQTIAFGFLTMSLLTHLFHRAMNSEPITDPEKQGVHLNYGFDRMRLIAPVRTGSRIRGHFTELSRSKTKAGHALVRVECAIEIEHEPKPALSGIWLAVWVPPGSTNVLALTGAAQVATEG
jgi:acyl dehydratase